MKRLALLPSAAVAASMFVACGPGSPESGIPQPDNAVVIDVSQVYETWKQSNPERLGAFAVGITENGGGILSGVRISPNEVITVGHGFSTDTGTKEINNCNDMDVVTHGSKSEAGSTYKAVTANGTYSSRGTDIASVKVEGNLPGPYAPLMGVAGLAVGDVITIVGFQPNSHTGEERLPDNEHDPLEPPILVPGIVLGETRVKRLGNESDPVVAVLTGLWQSSLEEELVVRHGTSGGPGFNDQDGLVGVTAATDGEIRSKDEVERTFPVHLTNSPHALQVVYLTITDQNTPARIATQYPTVHCE